MADDEYQDIDYTVTLTISTEMEPPTPTSIARAIFRHCDEVSTPEAVCVLFDDGQDSITF